MSGWTLATLAGAAWLAYWLVSCWLWPFTTCRRCDGGRRNPGSNAKRWGRCRSCGGTGERMRFGAKTVHRALARRK